MRQKPFHGRARPHFARLFAGQIPFGASGVTPGHEGNRTQCSSPGRPSHLEHEYFSESSASAWLEISEEVQGVTAGMCARFVLVALGKTTPRYLSFSQ